MKRTSALSSGMLVWRSLQFYWRNHFALLAGIVAATAVMTGALIVGDSVRHSLQELTLKRLQGVDYSMISPRFFRLELVEEFQEQIKASELADVTAAPVLNVAASASVSHGESLRVVGQVNCYGLDERGRGLVHLPENALGQTAEEDEDSPAVAISSQLAQELGVSQGETITMSIEVPSMIPRNSLLGERDVEQTTLSLDVRIAAVLSASEGGGRFSLLPNQQLPKTVFFDLFTLQQQLGLDERAASRRGPARISRVNGIFLGGTNRLGREVSAVGNAQQLHAILQSTLKLEDLQISLTPIPASSLNTGLQGYSIESERMVLEEQLETAFDQMKLPGFQGAMPMMVYLANELLPQSAPKATEDDSEQRSMYSVVAGVPTNPTSAFAELLPQGTLNEQDIVLTDWLAEDLKAAVGDHIILKYNLVQPDGSLEESESTFQVAGIVPLSNPAVADRTLTPTIEGITDAKTLRDWDQPFEMDFDRITQRDEDYWDQYKATPKAYVSLETATSLWGSPFGRLTSYRVALKPEDSAPDSKETSAIQSEIEQSLNQTLDLEKLGLVMVPIKFQGLVASQGTTDFTGLFVGFSFFIIISAAILIALLFRLAIEKRQSQIGLLSAIGWSIAQIHSLWRKEVRILVLIGTAIGTGAAIGYAWLMLYGLRNWWIGAIGTQELQLNLNPISLLAGGAITLILSYLVIWMSFRGMLKQSARQLMQAQSAISVSQNPSRTKRQFLIGSLFTILAITLLLGGIMKWIPETMAFSGFSIRIVCFFLSGLFMLTGGLFLLIWLIKSRTLTLLTNGKSFSQLQLGMVTLSRNQSRSVMTTVLIASATFVIVAVTSGQQDLTDSTPRLDSGNGGFSIVAQSSLPVLGDLNSLDDRIKLGIEDSLNQTQQELVRKSSVYAFRLRPGEDASCLNLYQTQLPTILGVSDDFIERGGFSFAEATQGNPWESLKQRTQSGNIPVFGDMNTLMYSLHKSPGQTIELPEQINSTDQLEVTQMLAGSVFQGVLLMYDQHFEALFPEQVGVQYFLIEASPSQADDVLTAYETGVQAYGLDAELVGDRLTNFLSVQNTYLATFQFLGGLGLLLGTIGLGTVMLRNVLDRQRELGLLRAVGYHTSAIRNLVLIEAVVLLILGLVWGSLSAFVAMAPHLTSQASALPVGSLALLLISVVVTGLLSLLFAIRAATSQAIIPALRSE